MALFLPFGDGRIASLILPKLTGAPKVFFFAIWGFDKMLEDLLDY